MKPAYDQAFFGGQIPVGATANASAATQAPFTPNTTSQLTPSEMLLGPGQQIEQNSATALNISDDIVGVTPANIVAENMPIPVSPGSIFAPPAANDLVLATGAPLNPLSGTSSVRDFCP